MRRIRSITNKPLHITKINNKELLQCRNAPVANPLRRVTTRRDNIAARWETQFDPMMRNESFWSQITGMHEDLQAHLFRQNNDGAGPIPADPVHRCTECEKCFTTQSSLRMHMSKVHTGKKKDRSIRAQDPDAEVRKHGTNRMPQCRYCGLVMQRWPNLNRHITLNRCEKCPYVREGASLPPEPRAAAG